MSSAETTSVAAAVQGDQGHVAPDALLHRRGGCFERPRAHGEQAGGLSSSSTYQQSVLLRGRREAVLLKTLPALTGFGDNTFGVYGQSKYCRLLHTCGALFQNLSHAVFVPRYGT